MIHKHRPAGRLTRIGLFRWRDAAGTVSSEELQTLWGRALAGEIKSPGSFSLRTLEFMKNISQEEALKITKAAPFVINNDFIVKDAKLLDSEGISFSFLLYLQNLGITCGVDATGLSSDPVEQLVWWVAQKASPKVSLDSRSARDVTSRARVV